MRAYEIGQRWLVAPQLWYDVTAFYNDYVDLRSGEAGGQLRNFMYGRSSGVEVALRWEPAEHWRLDTAYTRLVMGLNLDPVSTSNRGQLAYIEGLAARDQASLRAAFDAMQGLQFDATLRYTGRLPALNYAAYTELDAAVTWSLQRAVEISVVGQNLFDAHHHEQAFAFSSSGIPTEVQRSVYGKVTWRF